MNPGFSELVDVIAGKPRRRPAAESERLRRDLAAAGNAGAMRAGQRGILGMGPNRITRAAVAQREAAGLPVSPFLSVAPVEAEE
jgi:hypothetical protein